MAAVRAAGFCIRILTSPHGNIKHQGHRSQPQGGDDVYPEGKFSCRCPGRTGGNLFLFRSTVSAGRTAFGEPFFFSAKTALGAANKSKVSSTAGTLAAVPPYFLSAMIAEKTSHFLPGGFFRCGAGSAGSYRCGTGSADRLCFTRCLIARFSAVLVFSFFFRFT